MGLPSKEDVRAQAERPFEDFKNWFLEQYKDVAAQSDEHATAVQGHAINIWNSIRFSGPYRDAAFERTFGELDQVVQPVMAALAQNAQQMQETQQQQQRTAEELEKTAEIEQKAMEKLESALGKGLDKGGTAGAFSGAALGAMNGGKRGAVLGGVAGATGASMGDVADIAEGAKAVHGLMRGASAARGAAAVAGAGEAAAGAAGLGGAAGAAGAAGVAAPIVAGVMAVNKVGSDMMQKNIDKLNKQTEKMNSGVTASNQVAAKMQSDAQKQAEETRDKAQAEAEKNSSWGASARKYGGAGLIFHPLIKKNEERKAAKKAKEAQEKAEKIKKDVENVGNLMGVLWMIVLYGILFALTGVLGDFGMVGWLVTAVLIVMGIVLLIYKHGYIEFKTSPYGKYAIIAYVLHVLTLRYFYSSGTVNLTAVLTISFGVYAIIGLFYWIFFRDPENEQTPGEQKTHNLKVAAVLLLISIIIYSLPGLAAIMHERFPGFDTNLDIYYATIYLTVMVSPWMLYSLRRMEDVFPDGNAAAILRIFKLVVIGIPILVITLFLFTKALAMIPNMTITGVDAKTGIIGTYERIQELAVKTFKRWAGLAERAKDPGAYYTGQVDENQKQPLGVTLETLYSVDKTMTVNESEIIIVGEVKAKSFIGSSILVRPTCTIETKGAPVAAVDPAEMEVIFSTTQGFQCTFPPMEKRGTFTVKSSATFPFETWAYIPYTFVDEERARNIARQGQSVQQVFGIPERPVATYTSGPIKVGMGGSSMPLLVNTNKDPIMMAGSQIGLTIDNGWETGGVIQRVKRIELKVPQPFTLRDCTRPLAREPYPDAREPTYNDFEFVNDQVDKNVGWTSITCKIDIPREAAEDAFAMVAQGDAVTRSFIAVIEYDYAIEKSTTIQVR